MDYGSIQKNNLEQDPSVLRATEAILAINASVQHPLQGQCGSQKGLPCAALVQRLDLAIASIYAFFMAGL